MQSIAFFVGNEGGKLYYLREIATTTIKVNIYVCDI